MNAKAPDFTQQSSSLTKVGKRSRTAKQGAVSVTVGDRRRSSSSSSNIRVADDMEDEFIGKLVAFNCNT